MSNNPSPSSSSLTYAFPLPRHPRSEAPAETRGSATRTDVRWQAPVRRCRIKSGMTVWVEMVLRHDGVGKDGSCDMTVLGGKEPATFLVILRPRRQVPSSKKIRRY